MRQSGYSREDLNSALKQLDTRFDRLVTVADSAPVLTHDLVTDFRQSLFQVIDRLQTSSAATLDALSIERSALAGDLREQRRAVMLDVANLTTRAIKESGVQARSLVREAILLILVFVIVVSGVPFVVGYVVGRERGRRLSMH
jgi:hypothetical protein